jgi:hypothetical protein
MPSTVGSTFFSMKNIACQAFCYFEVCIPQVNIRYGSCRLDTLRYLISFMKFRPIKKCKSLHRDLYIQYIKTMSQMPSERIVETDGENWLSTWITPIAFNPEF